MYNAHCHHPRDAQNNSNPNGDNPGKSKFFGISSESISILKKFESSNVARDSSASQCGVNSAENGIPTPMTPLGCYITQRLRCALAALHRASKYRLPLMVGRLLMHLPRLLANRSLKHASPLGSFHTCYVE